MELPSLREGMAVPLRAKPTNPHDPAAVEILYGTAKLGYVPRFCNRQVNRLLLEEGPVACEVARVDPGAPPWEAVAVRIFLSEPPDVAGWAHDRFLRVDGLACFLWRDYVYPPTCLSWSCPQWSCLQ